MMYLITGRSSYGSLFPIFSAASFTFAPGLQGISDTE